MKTFIRRPGNKTRHLKHIIPIIPKFSGTYIEPFLGTGAVYLDLLPKKAILNDINKDIIDIWKLVKEDPDYIIKEINKFKKLFLPLSNKDKLLFCRNIIKQMGAYTDKKRTVMYLLMIYCSFNGSIDNDKNPIRGINGNIYSKNICHIFTQNYIIKVKELQNILKNIKIENKDYKLILKRAREGDFVFLDPPYIEDKKYDFEYNKDQKFDILDLKLELDKLTKKNIKWIMTQIDTTEVRTLFKNYIFYTYINNSNFNNSNTQKKELVISNY